MNTKILVALVIATAVVGLTGAASACQTTTSDLYYQFVHTVEGQGIKIIDDMPAITSGAGWDVGGYCDGENALIRNTLVNVDAKFEDDTDGIYHATLTQAGSASITKRPLDSEDFEDELEIGMMKAQDLTVSGQFTSVGAVFADAASVGTNYYDPIEDTVSHCGNCHATEESKARANVQANGDAKISEAAMGTSSWTSLSADGWMHGPLPDGYASFVTMDGGSSAYSSFYGDSIVPEGDSITTFATVETTHGWNCGCGAPTIPMP